MDGAVIKGSSTVMDIEIDEGHLSTGNIYLDQGENMIQLTPRQQDELLLFLAEYRGCSLMSLVPDRTIEPTNNHWLDAEAHYDNEPMFVAKPSFSDEKPASPAKSLPRC